MPMTSPLTTGTIPCLTTRWRTSRVCAPSAMRTPSIQVDIIRLGDFARPHISHHANDLARNARAADEQCLSERIFVAKNFLRPSLADDDDLLAIGGVVLIKIAPGEKRNAPCLEVVWRDVVTDGCGAFIYRQNLAVSPRV